MTAPLRQPQDLGNGPGDAVRVAEDAAGDGKAAQKETRGARLGRIGEQPCKSGTSLRRVAAVEENLADVVQDSLLEVMVEPRDEAVAAPQVEQSLVEVPSLGFRNGHVRPRSGCDLRIPVAGLA